MPKTKRDSAYSVDHSLQRYKERYGKELDLQEYNLWNDMAKSFINNDKKNENISTVSKIKVNDKNTSYTLKIINKDEIIYAVFETERNTITTFLPPMSIPIKKMK
jgi:hypothetical protein